MQSYRNRRMKPESKYCGQTVHVQAGQEPTVQTLNLVATNGPCLASTNRVQFEEPEEFKLLTETCPMVFPYMPSIQRRKAHQKTQRNVRFHTPILVVVSQAGKQANSSDRFCRHSCRFRRKSVLDPLCHSSAAEFGHLPTGYFGSTGILWLVRLELASRKHPRSWSQEVAKTEQERWPADVSHPGWQPRSVAGPSWRSLLEEQG